jgi:hypothetical protein
MTNHKIVKVEWYAPRIDTQLIDLVDAFNSECLVTSIGFMVEGTRNLTIFTSIRDGKVENLLTIPDCCILSMEVLGDKED